MDANEAVEVVRTIAEAVAYNLAVWHRGGTGERSGRAQARALATGFEKLIGRKPTAEELDRMGGTSVFIL